MIKFERFWDSDSVRETCIKFEWYTNGNMCDYSNLLDFVDSHKPTDKNINLVVEDIFNHSDQEGRDIESVAYCFGRFAVSLKIMKE